MWVVWSLPPQGDSGGPNLHLPCSTASRSSTYIELPSCVRDATIRSPDGRHLHVHFHTAVAFGLERPIIFLSVHERPPEASHSPIAITGLLPARPPHRPTARHKS